jgi:hypothetical protein
VAERNRDHLDYTAKSKNFDFISKHTIQLVRCDAAEAESRDRRTDRPSEPLVGGLREWRTRIRGSIRGQTCHDGSRTEAVEPSFNQRWLDPRVVSGLDPSSSVSVWCHRPQALILLLCPSLPGSGGDEETRTPDPLLAKEMLCQLSYVPLVGFGGPGRVVGVSGLEPETSALSGQCSNQLS